MRHVIALFVAFCSMNVGAKLEARPVLSMLPEVRYSEMWCCGDQEDRVGFFDVMYFNSVIPYGSVVTLHYGFERDDYAPLKSQRPISWFEPATVQLTQWGEFDWFVRVTHEIERHETPFRLVGFDFWFEIKTPSGEIIIERGASSANGYMLAKIPEMDQCQDLETDVSRRVCLSTVSVVDRP